MQAQTALCHAAFVTTDRGITPRRTVRVPADDWEAAKHRAQQEGKRLSDVLREFIHRYGTGQ